MRQLLHPHAWKASLYLDHRQDEVDDCAGVEQVVPRLIPEQLGGRERSKENTAIGILLGASSSCQEYDSDLLCVLEIVRRAGIRKHQKVRRFKSPNQRHRKHK